MTRFNSFDKFTISSKPVMVDYIHAGVFVPELNFVAANDRFCFSPLANPSMKLAYWDKDAYANELTVSAGVEEKPKAMNASSSVSAFDEAAAAAEKEGLVNPEDGNAKSKKRKGDQATKGVSKKVLSFKQLQTPQILIRIGRTRTPPILEQSPRRTSRRQTRSREF